ncbi:MAG TPA: hypothetical protein VNA04_04420 [Thermoanaerobaculia bacterium]|nr:hypothetical protein [Thermoanaerobaculia bacterium]
MGFLARHPDAAAAVLEEQRVDVAADFLAEIPARLGGPVLARMMPFQASRCLIEVEPEAAAGLVREMPHAVAATSLRQWPASKREQLLERLPSRLAFTLRLLLGYPGTAVGAWMDPRPALLPAGEDAASALERLRLEDGEIDRVVFVINREQKLEGQVRFGALLRAGGRTPLSALLEAVPTAVPARAALIELRDHPVWDGPDPVPVLSRDGRVVGALRYADLRRGLAAAHDQGRGAPGDSLVNLADGSWIGMARILEGVLRILPPARPPAPPPEKKP